MTQPFNLLRWFSILSLAIVASISMAFASVLSHFLVREILDREAMLTNEFVTSIITVQDQQARFKGDASLVKILVDRVDLVRAELTMADAALVRNQFYDHIRLLPDVLLANLYSADRKIVWSTNPQLIGTFDKDNDELEDTFKTGTMTVTTYLDQENHRDEMTKREQAFIVEPQKYFVESYMPLFDENQSIIAVMELYKEPKALLAAVKRCRQLVWSTTGLGMILLYLAMFWLIRRADRTLEDQQRRLVDSETMCVIGEMSASVAHGIRNPLASIRSSAELALDGDLPSVRKNADDIISQVDRLGKWVRDLLVFSRPVSGDIQAMDLVSLIDECLPHFAAQLEKNRVSCAFMRPDVSVPPVRGNRPLATQALANIISNAIEAMPGGGSLALELEVEDSARLVSLIVSDTGPGMTTAQMDLVFKPFYTTKRNGLGLGMSLVKRIMERLGGAIRLHTREGGGTRVYLTFSTD